MMDKEALLPHPAFRAPHSKRFFVPDGVPMADALRRTTHLGIMAHPDDLEFWAYHGIAECYEKEDRWFGGIILTDGAGAPRGGNHENDSDDNLVSVREEEQRKAASLGKYSFVAQLGYSSREVKENARGIVKDLHDILENCHPTTIYLHNPADKHPTHVATFLRALEAIRHLPENLRLTKVYGCEGWRGLDWLPDAAKVGLDTSQFPELRAALQQVFESQILGGKRYDLAVPARNLANATLFDSHSIDQAPAITWALDLRPLISNPSLSIQQFIDQFITQFRSDVLGNISKIG